MADLTDILGDQEAFMAVKRCGPDCYELFFSNIKKHFSKFPNNQAKELLSPLITNDLVTIGFPERNKNLLLGQTVRTSNNSLAGVIVNTITHDIDFDGNSLNFSKIIGSIYYIVIEYALRLKFSDDIIKDKITLQKVEHYFEYILVKNLKLFELYQEKRALFDFVVKVFFYVHFGKRNINIAYEESMVDAYADIIKSTVPIAKLSKYKSLSNLYDVLYDFNIVPMTPNNMKYMLTNSIGIFSYINIHASLSSLIGSIILSKYKHPNFSSLFVSVDMIDGIESVILNKYLSKIDFDTKAMHKAFNSVKEDPKIKTKV